MAVHDEGLVNEVTDSPSQHASADIRTSGQRLLRFWVLSLVADGPRYGYQIHGAICATGGMDFASNGHVYRTLRQLERTGATVSYWDTAPSGGPPRRMYELTSYGKRELERYRAGMAELVQLIRHITRLGHCTTLEA